MPMVRGAAGVRKSGSTIWPRDLRRSWAAESRDGWSPTEFGGMRPEQLGEARRVVTRIAYCGRYSRSVGRHMLVIGESTKSFNYAGTDFSLATHRWPRGGRSKRLSTPRGFSFGRRERRCGTYAFRGCAAGEARLDGPRAKLDVHSITRCCGEAARSKWI